MRIVVCGANEFGYELTESLIDWGYKPVGIFTIPEKFEISYSENEVNNCLYKNFLDFQDYGIPIKEVEEKFDTKSNYEKLKKWDPDIFFAAGWYYLIPQKFRNLASKGAVGIHHSLLPKYRGGAPLVWAIINGEKIAGTTLFELSSGVDDGDIIAQKEFIINHEDTIKTVYQRANKKAFAMVEEQLPLIENGRETKKKQNDNEATTYPQRSPEDGLINWNWSAQKIYNFIRAQTHPYPGAFSFVRDQKVKIWESEILNQKSRKNAGIILEFTNDGDIIVCTGSSEVLKITDFDIIDSDEFSIESENKFHV